MKTSNCEAPSSDLTTTRSTPRTLPKTAVLVLFVGALFAGIVAPTAPADAATNWGYGTACFRTPSAIVGFPSLAWPRKVRVEYWNGQPAHSTYVYPDKYGCVTAWLPTGYYWRFNAEITTEYYAARFTGATAWKYVAGYYTYDYGTVMVYQQT
jgi:hypothetical protein